jgi:GNAT superfamily N-acetyltransferase
MIALRTLDAEQICAHADEFIRIAADQPGEYWTLNHFLLDLPEKWTLSFAAWDDNSPVAYAILSRKDADRVHLHHFMVTPLHRGKGLGACMIREMKHRTVVAGAKSLTLKADATDRCVRAFYRQYGFEERGVERGYILLATLPPASES